MRPTPYLMILALLITACFPTKNMGNPQNFIPAIGTIGKEQKSLLNKNFEQIGIPNINDGIALTIREIPFTKPQFKTYVQFKTGKGEKVDFAYVDSTIPKPEYLGLEISNKINLQMQLNHSDNNEVRSYLANDEAYRIVTQISVLTSESLSLRMQKADGIFLNKDKNGLLNLEIVEGNLRTFLNWWDLEIFDYQLSGFCWGTDRYGKKIIKVIQDDGVNCPKGTEKKARKLNDIKSYSKL